MHLYEASGLSIDSEIELPGLIVRRRERATADVVVRRGSVPSVLEGSDVSGPTWEIAGERFLLRIPSVARFLLTSGRSIEFETAAGADAGDVAIFVLGTVFGILLHQRGQIVLHGSAVRVNEKAVLFCGSSGAGKSTLAAALVQRGFECVADDVCAISLTGAGGPAVHSDGRQLKLWAQAIKELQLGELSGARVRRPLEKYYVAHDGVATEPLTLGAVYVLREARPPHQPGVEKANIVDSALLLRRNAYRPLLVSRMGQREKYFHAASAIANVAGVYHLTRTFSFAALPECVDILTRHWSEIGLTDSNSMHEMRRASVHH